VVILRATKKLLQRIGRPTLRDGDQSTTQLGQWYAAALFWKPQIALLINEPTLLPVLMPLRPGRDAAGPTRRADRHRPRRARRTDTYITVEVEHMNEWRVGPTANRSVVGIMNEFTFLANTYRDGNPSPSLLAPAAHRQHAERAERDRSVRSRPTLGRHREHHPLP
jgi:hypothetical protein